MSPQFKTRIAGALYLLAGLTAFALFVRGRLVVVGDVAATASNILTHESLFRLGLTADLFGISCYIAVTALFYSLFKPVNRHLSVLAAVFSLMGFTIQTFALVVLRGAQYLSVFKVEPFHTLALLFLRLHALAFNIGLVFFGIYCLLIGYLVSRSTFLPRVLAVLMAVAGLGWLTFVHV